MRKMSVWALITVAFAGALAAAACGDDSAAECDNGEAICDPIDCASITIPTYQDLPLTTCVTCHASDAADREAAGVPPDSDYTTYAGIKSRIKKIAVRINGDCEPMPPDGSPALSPADLATFTNWGCCGGPEK